MTVISAVISTHCIAVSSDSLLTVYNSKTKVNEIIETRKPKIIKIEKFLGAFSYWGLAAKSKYSNWTTYDWLKRISNKAQYFNNLEEFAIYVKDELEKEIKSFRFDNKYKGIGIHLTGYENYDGYKIPELFLISNFTDESYMKVGTLGVSRHLYPTMPKEFKSSDENISQQEKQILVKDFLTKGRMFIFNNGDPVLFNPLFDGFKEAMKTAKKRNVIKNSDDIEIYRAMARRPIEMVTRAQKDFYKEGKIIVGGRVHDLVIKKNTEEFTSTSGVK